MQYFICVDGTNVFAQHLMIGIFQKVREYIKFCFQNMRNGRYNKNGRR